MPSDRELHAEIELDATPEQVWHAIATPEGLAAWFMPVPPPPPDSDLVTAHEPPHHLAVEIPLPDGATQAFEYLITATGGGSTVLKFTHGFSGGDWTEEFFGLTAAGWAMYLHTLAEYFRHFAGRPAVYVEAEAGPTGTFAALLDALALPAPAVGDPVALELTGLPRIDGVVDYRSSGFLGIRTADALYRFHDRQAIGLPIAVGHHLYGGTESTPEQWREWLAQSVR
jgi:hypothetical protein